MKEEKKHSSKKESSAPKFRKRCYLDIAIGERNAGRLVIELYDDVVPRTAENFRGLATSEYGMGQTTHKKLTYQGVLFHRVIKDFMIQAGDFTAFDGTGGESIYGGKFPDENFILKHDRPFLVSMANAGVNTNGSQFFITCQPCPFLDNKHVVFGQVVAGQELVREIEALPTKANDVPEHPVRVIKCGELVPVFADKSKKNKKEKHKKRSKRDSSSSSSSSSSSGSSSSSDSEKEKKRRKRKKAKKAKEKEKKEKSKAKTEAKPEPEVYCTVRPEEIPEVPSNRFLQRHTSPPPEQTKTGPPPDHARSPEGRGRQPEVREADSSLTLQPGTKVDYPSSFDERNRQPNRFADREPLVRKDFDGITVKGRGKIRFNARRSETPPHWKNPKDRDRPWRQRDNQAGYVRQEEPGIGSNSASWKQSKEADKPVAQPPPNPPRSSVTDNSKYNSIPYDYKARAEPSSGRREDHREEKRDDKEYRDRVRSKWHSPEQRYGKRVVSPGMGRRRDSRSPERRRGMAR
ncbi:uncharacterized protein LOC129583883 [Paramacrobiotus metropolitanus]|uniref:uncharacterized protein LOC129583883 n=1 Tax=Paramacrobiotus metropolitanus TaxID=2943436 RepID=UPI002445D0DC|nr:uncharacterized protein LOC129583883 [Paramacrobiotus metropolitanus]